MLIRGGTIVTGAGEQEADILVRDGKVVRVAPGIAGDQDTIDASGLLVLPGVVDPHTHLLLDTGTARTADDFESGSASAAAGGVTTYLEFAPQGKGQTFLQALAARRRLMDGHSHVDYGVHMTIAHLGQGWERDLEALVEAGVTSAKIYTTYRDTIFYADDWTWYRLMERSGGAGLLVQVHAENDAIVEGMTRQLLTAGKRSLRYHGVARPAVAEVEAVARGLLFSRTTGSPVYFVHLSTPESVDLIAQARRDGVRAIAETCPHYLVLDDPRPQRRLAASELHSRAGFSPYEGMTVTGRVKATVVRGRVVYRDGSIVAKPGDGIYQRCDPFDWRRAVA